MSKLFNVDWKDLLKAFIVCILSVIYFLAAYYVAQIKIVADPTVNANIVAAISTFLGYLSKQFLTSEDGKILGINTK